MRMQEFLDGHSLRETDEDESRREHPLATVAVPGAATTGGVAGFAGAAPVYREFPLTGLKPLRRLKRLDRRTIAARDGAIADQIGRSALRVCSRTTFVPGGCFDSAIIREVTRLNSASLNGLRMTMKSLLAS